ncbi:MAG: uracil-DNA glycosylase [Ktedonobacterales bacterium]
MSAEALLEQIAVQVRDCTKCDLYKGTKHGVPGEGSAHAEVMLIGEAPGFNEDRQGRPFVGPAGGFLNELLEVAGLQRPDVFIANVVKHRPPENRDPLPEEIAACAEYLTHQIAAIDPKVIVTLGRFSMARFFPDARIGRIHGQYKVVDGRVVVAMYHPAAALHQQTLRQTLVDDFRTAVPAALAMARQLAAAGKLGKPANDQQSEGEPPQQLSLF